MCVMRTWFGRFLLAAAGLIWLAGCATTSSPDNPFVKLGDKTTSASASDGDGTGSGFASATPLDSPPLKPELLGEDPNDDLSIGKKYYRQGSYGLAEQQFRKVGRAASARRRILGRPRCVLR